ncbi:Superkiller protein 3 [Coemansia sp. Benny D115]|nr:Superkiller protein 3 [Coemansia sp. Benny D115]
MSVIFKGKMKAAKAAVADKDYEYAYELCHDLLDLDKSSYNAHILLGVACQHLKKWDEGEKIYLAAQGMSKANILAWQGMCALAEAQGDTVKHRGALEALLVRQINENAMDKAWESMNALLAQAESDSNRRTLVAELRRLVEGGDLHILLSYGVDTPAEREVLERMYNEEEQFETSTIEKEVAKRRTRLGAGPVSRVRREVQAEVWEQSGLLDTLSRLVALNQDSDTRALWELRYFDVLRQRALGNPASNEMGAEAARVAWDLVSIGADAPVAYEFLLDAAACGGPGVGAELGRKYVEQCSEGLLVEAVRASEKQAGAAAERLDLALEGQRRVPDSPFALLQVSCASEAAGVFDMAAKNASAAREAMSGFWTTTPGAAAALELVAPGSEFHGPRLMDELAGGAYLRMGAAHVADAEICFRRVLKAEPTSAVATLGLGLALCEMKRYDESVGLLERAVSDAGDDSTALGQALGGLGAVYLHRGDAARAREHLERAVALDPSAAVHHRRLGWAYWHLGGTWQTERQYAHGSWMAAVRLDNSDASAFEGLAQWYHLSGDMVRERRCLAKAAELDPSNATAGEQLACIYAREGRDDLCQILLERAVQADRAQRWAWRMLGHLHMRQERAVRAIEAFRAALGGANTDARPYEGMCEAYMAIGRANAAVRVAERVIELTPGAFSGHWLHSQALMAAGDPETSLKALVACQKADSDGKWADAIAMARAEAAVACAELWHTQGLFARVAEACAGALQALSQCGHLGFHAWGLVLVACAWTVRVQPLVERRPELQSPAQALRTLETKAAAAESQAVEPEFLRETRSRGGIKEAKTADEADYVLRLCMLAERAGSLRVLCASTVQRASMAWADLALVYCGRYSAQSSVALFRGAAVRSEEPLISAAERCAQAAVQLDDSNVRVHLVQGVVATWAENAMLAQHALIQATRYTATAGSSVTAWTMLGFLYVHRGDVELGKRAFERAVIADPESTIARLGVAVAAELLGSGTSTACVDLYEACVLSADVSAAPRAVADYAFAKHVWLALATRKASSGTSALSLVEQSRLALALFAVRRYRDRAADASGEGDHLLGLLLEQNGEWAAAADAYREHVRKAVPGGARAWIARTHLARALCSAGEYADSVRAYAEAAETAERPDAPRLVFYATLGRSLALFFAGQLEDSLGHFEQTLALAEEAQDMTGQQQQQQQRQRGVVAVMLAQVLWALGSSEHRALARQMLLDVVAAHEDGSAPALGGLATLFAMGVVLGEADLVSAAHAELRRHYAVEPLHTVARLEALLGLVQDDAWAARRSLVRALMRSPADAGLWLHVARLDLAQGRPADALRGAVSAGRLCRQALLARRAPRAAASLDGLGVMVGACAAEAAAAAAMVATNARRRRQQQRAARRAVMLRPWAAEGCWDLI